MANYAYVYNEDDIRPAEPVEYKHYTVYPNKVLALSLMSLLPFSALILPPIYFLVGWFGIFLASYALVKERVYVREHDGETHKKVKAGKIIAITSIIVHALIHTVYLGWGIFYLFIVPIIYAPEAEETLYFGFNLLKNLI